MEEKVTLTPELKQSIIDKIQIILDRTHSVSEKRKTNPHHSRLQIACPYCGDSFNDKFAKRGNIYWQNGYYHCYNSPCKHVPITQFLKDFDQPLENDDLYTVTHFIKSHKKEISSISPIEFGIFKDIQNLGVEKQLVFEKLNLYEINEKTYRAYPYLRSRLLVQHLDQFAYNPKKKELFILNYSKDYTKIIGMQSKNLSFDGAKYLTYTIEKVRKLCDLKSELDEEYLEKLNRFSTLFGIMNLDMTRDFTVFEGPIDSMFLRNSVAITGAGKKTFDFDELPTVKYFFDNDIAGKTVMIDKLKEGKRVFLWTKFLKENSLDNFKIKDLNDLVKICYKHKSKALLTINQYFSDNTFDIIYV